MTIDAGIGNRYRTRKGRRYMIGDRVQDHWGNRGEVKILGPQVLMILWDGKEKIEAAGIDTLQRSPTGRPRR